jgi:hypothetical protein
MAQTPQQPAGRPFWKRALNGLSYIFRFPGWLINDFIVQPFAGATFLGSLVIAGLIQSGSTVFAQIPYVGPLIAPLMGPYLIMPLLMTAGVAGGVYAVSRYIAPKITNFVLGALAMVPIFTHGVPYLFRSSPSASPSPSQAPQSAPPAGSQSLLPPGASQAAIDAARQAAAAAQQRLNNLTNPGTNTPGPNAPAAPPVSQSPASSSGPPGSIKGWWESAGDFMTGMGKEWSSPSTPAGLPNGTRPSAPKSP